jgi:flagellar biosynthesis protein FlhF
MELKRIIARDSRSATEKAMSLYGPDVLVIANQSIDGQTELIVAIDIAPEAPAALVREAPTEGFQAMEPARVHKPASGNMQAFEEAMALVRNTQAAVAEAPARATTSAPRHAETGAPTTPRSDEDTTQRHSTAPRASGRRSQRHADDAATVFWGDMAIPTLADMGKPPENKPATRQRRRPAAVAEVPAMAQPTVDRTCSDPLDTDWQVPSVGDITIAPRSTARRRSATATRQASVANQTASVAEAPTRSAPAADKSAVKRPKVKPRVDAMRASEPCVANAQTDAQTTNTAASVHIASAPANSHPSQAATHTPHAAPNEATAQAERGRELVDLVRAEIAALRQEFVTNLKLQQLHTGGAGHPVAEPLMAALEQAGAPAALRSLLLDSAQSATDVADGAQRVREALTAGLQADALALPMSGVHALCGPSGAGKSLMAARWLQQAAQDHESDRLALISYCDQRPGAWSQTQMLAAQIGVPAYRVNSPDALQTLLNELSDRVLVVIDTPGTEPLRHAQTLLDQLPHIGLHTVLPADASAATVRRFLQESRLPWQSLLISKIDESEQPWGLLQQLCNQRIPIAGLSYSPHTQAPLQRWRPDLLVDRAMAPVAALLPPSEAPSVDERRSDAPRPVHSTASSPALGIAAGEGAARPRANAAQRTPPPAIVLNLQGPGRRRSDTPSAATPKHRPRPQWVAA